LSSQIRPTALVRALTYARDGQTIIGAGQDGQVNFWPLSPRGESRTIRLPPGGYGMALAPDGRHVAVGCGNGTVYLLRRGAVMPPSE
jgi:hypothetical protein